MYTRFFKQFMENFNVTFKGGISDNIPCVLTGRDNTGRYVVVSGYHSDTFPKSVEQNTIGISTTGIKVGKGDTPATEDDYKLEDEISFVASGTGIVAQLTSTQISNNEEYACKYVITLTNNTTEAVEINEIGIYYAFSGNHYNLYYDTYSSYPMLIDRTILTTPLILQAGDSGVIEYKLGTKDEKIVNGVKIVPFATGTSTDITNIITALRNGDITVRDTGWKIGDMKMIHLNSFDDGYGNTIPASDISVVITDFSEYNESGNVLQFDILCGLANVKINATNVTKYSETTLHTTTMQNIYNALPTWFKDLLVPFNILAFNGDSSDPQNEIIRNNKLEIRSLSEMNLSNTGVLDEGVAIKFYHDANNRVCYPFASNTAVGRWTRSKQNNAANFAIVTTNGSGSTSAQNAPRYLTVFGCI